MSLTHPRALGLSLTFVLISAAALAQDPQPPAAEVEAKAKPADPKAQALLEQVAKAYQGLASYADEGKFVISMTIGDDSEEQTVPIRLAFVRPNKLNLDAGPVQLLSDGETLTTSIRPLKKYLTAPAPAAVNLETFRDGPAGAMLFGGPAGAPLYILANLLTSPEPIKSVDELGGSLQLAGDDSKGEALLIENADGPSFRLAIDPATKLLKSIDLVIDPKVIEESAREGHPIKIAKFGWEAGAITTDAAKAPSFAFQVPDDFTKVDSARELDEAAAQRFAVEDLVDQPAPDFTLTLLDGPDKTKTVSKADLAGKIVVIDFWATWCGPCLIELPEIQKLVDEIEKDKKNVLVVALSQDQQPAELSEVRKLVEKTLQEKELKFLDRTGAVVGLDPSNTVGEQFQVEGLPTLVVLDGEGVVRSAHVGFSPEIRETLTAEIDALLAGKPLTKPAAEEAAAKE